MPHIHHFFVEHLSSDERDLDLKDENIVHQIVHVLRLHQGETIILLDNTGFEYEYRIIEATKKSVELYLLSKRENDAEPTIHIHLYQSLLKKKEKFELVLQKGTEVGVSHFIPLKSEHCEFVGNLNMQRFLDILKEASEQSHRGIIPELSGTRVFSDAIKEAPGTKLICDADGEPFQNYKLTDKNYSLFIGPEGGFAPREIIFAREQGCQIISIGQRILRSETAGIVIPSLLLYS